ncbi:MAG: hypothetical protein QM736_19295 [Vicinamibacterales bacterium]
MPVDLESWRDGRGVWIRVSGTVTSDDLKRAFLLRVGQGGWERPAALDVTRMTDTDFTDREVAEMALFIRRLTRPHQPRGRLAVVVDTPQQRAIADTFRSLLGFDQDRVAIVTTADDADAWLEGDPSGA